MQRSRAAAGAWIASALAPFLAGIGLQLQQASLWPASGYLVAALAGAALLALSLWQGRRHRACIVLMAAGSLVIGFCWAGGRAHWRLREGLAPALEGRVLEVTGTIATLPEVSPAGTRFLFEVESATIEGSHAVLPALLSLGWYADEHDSPELRAQRAGLRAGLRWRLPVKLKRPHGSINPGGFDYELWLFEQGVRASGYVRPPTSSARSPASAQPAPALLGEGAPHPVERLRQRVRDAIAARVDDARAAGVLMALSVGDQGAIDSECGH